MRRILVLRHMEQEALGTLGDALALHGYPYDYVDLWRDHDAPIPWQDYAGLVVMGGVMNADEADRYPYLTRERAAIRLVADAGRAVLGICLGAQLIARAFDAPVYRNPVKEIGWLPLRPTPAALDDPLLSAFDPAGETVFHWHRDTFDLPAEATLLATAPTCAQQAFRIGDRVYGLQFHLEIDRDTIDAWLAVPEMGAEAAAHGGPALLPRLLTDSDRHLARFTRLADRVFSAWCELAAAPVAVRA